VLVEIVVLLLCIHVFLDKQKMCEHTGLSLKLPRLSLLSCFPKLLLASVTSPVACEEGKKKKEAKTGCT